eukprot:COSAG01_NODE_766_length_13741_cov_16.630479_11_plen_71_part_00
MIRIHNAACRHGNENPKRCCAAMQQACPSKTGWDPNCWHKQVQEAAASVAPLPFLLTEYVPPFAFRVHRT